MQTDQIDHGIDHEKDYKRALAIAAAQWWGSYLRSGHQASLTREAGCSRIEATVMEVMWGRMAPQQRSNLSNVDAFELILAGIVFDMLSQSSYGAYLNTDYGPEGMLLRAVDQSNVSPTFPHKTSMSVSVGSGISVSVGYHGETQWLSISKRQTVFNAAMAASSDRYPKGDRARADHWLRFDGAVRKALGDVPEHPDEDPEKLAASIVARAAEETGFAP